MKKNLKIISAVLFVLVMICAMIIPSNVNAKAKPKLNKKNITLYTGKTYTLKVNGTKAKVKWTTSNKRIATVSKKGKVTAKKKGKVTITAKVAKKKLKCKVTVKTLPKWAKNLIVTGFEGKKQGEVRALDEIIKNQRAQGAEVSKNLNDKYQYTWYNGKLTKLNWESSQLKKSIRFSKLENLKQIDLTGNELENIDLTNNILLENLECCGNNITSLYLSYCSRLKKLNCADNMITSLTISKCSSLEIVYCNKNQLTSFDFSNNPNLKEIDCSNNPLTSLRLDNPRLKELYCSSIQVKSLDLSKTPELTILFCNDNKLTSVDVSKCAKKMSIYADDCCTIIGNPEYY